MTLATLTLAVFLILFAISAFGWAVVSPILLGIFAFISGILFVLEAFVPITIIKRGP